MKMLTSLYDHVKAIINDVKRTGLNWKERSDSLCCKATIQTQASCNLTFIKHSK